MNNHVFVWDLETVPDLGAVSRMHGVEPCTDAEAEALLGDKFPKLPLHKIACIGVVIAERTDAGWSVRSIGAPHLGERTEPEIICGFVEKIAKYRPQLVSFNGHGFDLPVLRYRAMVNCVHAPGLTARPYFNRYSEDALDLCDALSSYDARSKLTLDALCRVLSLPGKPEGIEGSKVAEYVKAGRIREVADYCETDVINTYRLWLRYELFKGSISRSQFLASEDDLHRFVTARLADRPHLSFMIDASPPFEPEPA